MMKYGLRKHLEEMVGVVNGRLFTASKGGNKLKIDITSAGALTITIEQGGQSRVYPLDVLETRDLLKFLQNLK